MARADAIRDGQITQQAENGILAEDRLMRRDDMESRLYTAVADMTDRMLWVYKHPHLARTIGRSTIRLEGVYHPDSYRPSYSISTPIILGRTIIDGQNEMDEGYVFTRSWSGLTKHRRPLSINKTVRERTTGAKESIREYCLDLTQDSTGSRVTVGNKEFERYATQTRQAIVDAYAEHYPWVSEQFMLMESVPPLGEDAGMWLLPKYWGNKGDPEFKHKIEQVRRELVPKLQRGLSWNYSDELFQRPLDLVNRALVLLGRRT